MRFSFIDRVFQEEGLIVYNIQNRAKPVWYANLRIYIAMYNSQHSMLSTWGKPLIFSV
jgi:hypothetical protein